MTLCIPEAHSKAPERALRNKEKTKTLRRRVGGNAANVGQPKTATPAQHIQESETTKLELTKAGTTATFSSSLQAQSACVDRNNKSKLWCQCCCCPVQLKSHRWCSIWIVRGIKPSYSYGRKQLWERQHGKVNRTPPQPQRAGGPGCPTHLPRRIRNSSPQPTAGARLCNLQRPGPAKGAGYGRFWPRDRNRRRK